MAAFVGRPVFLGEGSSARAAQRVAALWPDHHRLEDAACGAVFAAGAGREALQWPRGLGVGGRVRACVSCSAVQATPTAVLGDCPPDLLLWARASPGALVADCAEREVSPPPAPRLPRATLVGDGTFAIWKSCCFMGPSLPRAGRVECPVSELGAFAPFLVCRHSCVPSVAGEPGAVPGTRPG